MIIASMASIPEREATLEIAVESLRHQVGFFYFYLNGYGIPPPFLNHVACNVYRSEDRGDIGDAGKFYCVPTCAGTGYHFTCDDDLEYPPDYVEKMVDAIEGYGRGAVVGLHGIELHRPLRPTYQASRKRVYHFGERLASNRWVDVLGTGCMAYHCSTMYVCEVDFPYPNMADIWFAVACQKARVPRVAIAHEANWVKQLPFESSIWDRRQNDPRLIEALRRGEPWGTEPSLPPTHQEGG